MISDTRSPATHPSRELLLVVALELTSFDVLSRKEARDYLVRFLKDRREEDD